MKTTIENAIAILAAPFAELAAYEAAKRTVLEAATVNQRRLYATIPQAARDGYLLALAKAVA